MPQPVRRLPGSWPCLLLSVALSACGGGSGSSAALTGIGTGVAAPANPVQTAPPATAPLPLTAANAKGATTLAFGYGALTLAIGQLALDWTAQAEASATLSFNQACAGGGTVGATLIDRDGDRRASAGDQLSVTLDGCYLKHLDDTMDGGVTVAFTAPAGAQQRAGTIAFERFRTHGGNPAQDMQGGLRFDYSTSRLSKLLHVTSDTQPFSLRFSDGKTTATETVTLLDAQHETRVDTVRATNAMRFHLASDLLAGSVDVATPTPWAGWFDTYPDAGELALTGANGSAAAVRARALPSQTVDVVFNGAAIDNVDFNGLGVLWTGAPWLPKVAAAEQYTVEQPTSSNFRLLLQPDPAAFQPNGALTWLYSRPLAPVAVGGATFLQTGAQPGSPAQQMFNPVPATVTIEGGLLTVKPSTQLLPGTDYRLQLEMDVNGIADAAGRHLDRPTFSGTVMQTVSASLSAGAAPILFGAGATLALDGSASSASGGPASYHWQQLSGPALSFSDTGAARVTIAPAAAANGTAVVELRVANAAGDVDRRTLAVKVAADPAQALVLAYRTDGGPLSIATSFDPDFSGYAKLWNGGTTLDVILGFRRFLAGRNDGQTWRSGPPLVYGNGSGSESIAPGWSGCFVRNTGTVTVLELALDAAGNLDRLALDFDDTCGGSVTLGSIRYRSSVPLR
ncbi:Ig-like domain-containing protein [Herbaspirillum sp. SJZ107]|uniref:Ig-like domain-containing protein n=1 Tax=Herbaspirillum sp. SJZ107 TaxID=2572881 RepID=UPI0011531505|nr:Ig-like domain-containing protein [Herbaspirillum sp. SJZ107]TQK10712.1 hypothetical protein FBX97_0635 [Herbaspirillum sp. SJZ107]